MLWIYLFDQITGQRVRWPNFSLFNSIAYLLGYHLKFYLQVIWAITCRTTTPLECQLEVVTLNPTRDKLFRVGMSVFLLNVNGSSWTPEHPGVSIIKGNCDKAEKCRKLNTNYLLILILCFKELAIFVLLSGWTEKANLIKYYLNPGLRVEQK